MIPTADMPDEILPLAILLVEEEIEEAALTKDGDRLMELSRRWLRLTREMAWRKRTPLARRIAAVLGRKSP